MSAPARPLQSSPWPWVRQRSTLRVIPSTAATALEPEVLMETLRQVGARWAQARGDGPEALQLHTHRFEPQGVSVVMLLPGLRGVLHTWPEFGLATLDLAGAAEAELTHRLRELATALGMEPTASAS